MSDRNGVDQSPPDDDDNLDYLDAGLPDDERIGSEPVRPEPDTPPAPAARPDPAVSPPDSRPEAQATTPVRASRPDPVDTPTPATPGPGDADVPGPVLAGSSGGDSGRLATSEDRDTSWNWPLANLVGLIIVVIANYAANYFELNGNSTGDVVNKDPVRFQPAGWVFSIWGVIYLLLFVFVIYGLLPAGRNNARLQRISPLFLVANIANVSWIVLWHYEQFAASMGVITILLLSLVGIYLGVRVRNPFRRGDREPAPNPGWIEKIALRVPFSIYLGWICVATFSNLMVWFDRSGRDGGVFSQSWWAIILMAIAALVALVFAVTAHDALIAIVMAVAFAGIAHHNWGDSTMVSVAAIVFSVIAVGIAGLAFVLSFDRNTNRSPFGRSPETGKPMAG